MIGNAGEDICEPGLRIDIVEPCGLDERVEDRGALAASIPDLVFGRKMPPGRPPDAFTTASAGALARDFALEDLGLVVVTKERR